MKVVLFGGTDITVAVGEVILEAGCDLAVVTIPQQFSISFSPGPLNVSRHVDVAGWADAHDLVVHRYENMDDLRAFASAADASVAVVAGWYHMLPRSLRDLFPFGCLGLHASLLPALRGHAPLNWAILTGARETGVTLFELGDGIDDGGVYGQRRIPVGPRTTIGELVIAARTEGAALVRDCITQMLNGTIELVPQVGEPTYCLSRVPDDGLVDWRLPAADVDRLVRAVSRPYPGAFAYLDEARITFWATALPPDAPPVHGAAGQLFRPPGFDNPCVVCGDGLLELTEATLDDGEDALELLRRRSYRRFGSRETGTS